MHCAAGGKRQRSIQPVVRVGSYLHSLTLPSLQSRGTSYRGICCAVRVVHNLVSFSVSSERKHRRSAAFDRAYYFLCIFSYMTM